MAYPHLFIGTQSPVLLCSSTFPTDHHTPVGAGTLLAGHEACLACRPWTGQHVRLLTGDRFRVKRLNGGIDFRVLLTRKSRSRGVEITVNYMPHLMYSIVPMR